MAHTIDTNLTGAASATTKALNGFGRIRHVAVKCLLIFAIWQERSEQRYALGELNERMLKDIGISRVDAYKEAQKPFWLP